MSPTLLSINSYYYRRDGSEVVYFGHNDLFETLGWQVVPFAMKHPQNRSSVWSGYFVDELEFGHPYGLLEKVRRVPRVVYSRHAQDRIGALLDAVHVDVAHCHSIYHHLSPSILPVLHHRGVPVVITLHDLKLACPAYHMFNDRIGLCEACKGGRLINVVRHRCVKSSAALSALIWLEATVNRMLGSYRDHVARFVSPCRFYVDKLVEWGWDPERFSVIPNPMNLDGWEPHYPPGDHILYFGRLSPEKGLLTLVRAAARSGVPVRLAGDGPQRPELESEVERLAAPVTFLGHLGEDALRDAVHACRATVLPAEWYENAPMSVLESYALGKPVIGARIGGMPEMIGPETGMLFRSGDVDELAACLTGMMELPDGCVEALGQGARHRVESQHAPAGYARAVKGVYDAVTHER